MERAIKLKGRGRLHIIKRALERLNAEVEKIVQSEQEKNKPEEEVD